MKILTSVSDKNVNTNNSGFTINKKEMVTTVLFTATLLPRKPHFRPKPWTSNMEY